MFHIDLLTPYKETIMHGPNFTRPAPELIDGEEEYSIEKILDSRRFSRRRRLQYLVKWEGYPDADNMWVDKDDVFAEDKVREFKASNPEAEVHIRSSAVAKSPYPPSPTRTHLLYQHALSCMSSDGHDDLAPEYPTGAIADSPIPFSQEYPVNTPVSVPVPIINFTTLQPLSATAPVFSPRPVSASSSASDVVTDLQGPPSERMQAEKLRDLKKLARQYAHDPGSCDDIQISYLESLEERDNNNLRLAQMLAM
jgi:hypothetical protein